MQNCLCVVGASRFVLKVQKDMNFKMRRQSQDI